MLDIYDPNRLAQLEIAIRVAIAGVFGSVVGLEHELAERPAAVRTRSSPRLQRYCSA
jgi:uncharacterized membrane protein YhiD involved in acid resistance